MKLCYFDKSINGTKFLITVKYRPLGRNDDVVLYFEKIIEFIEHHINIKNNSTAFFDYSISFNKLVFNADFINERYAEEIKLLNIEETEKYPLKNIYIFQLLENHIRYILKNTSRNLSIYGFKSISELRLGNLSNKDLNLEIIESDFTELTITNFNIRRLFFYKTNFHSIHILNSLFFTVILNKCFIKNVFCSNSIIIRDELNFFESNIFIFRLFSSNISILILNCIIVKNMLVNNSQIAILNILKSPYIESSNKIIISVEYSNLSTFKISDSKNIELHEIKNSQVFLNMENSRISIRHSDLYYCRSYNYDIHATLKDSIISRPEEDFLGNKIDIKLRSITGSKIDKKGFNIIPSVYIIRFIKSQNHGNKIMLKIGCKERTLKDWNYFFSTKCREVIETKRNEEDFKLIKKQYKNFIKDNKDFIKKHNIE